MGIIIQAVVAVCLQTCQLHPSITTYPTIEACDAQMGALLSPIDFSQPLAANYKIFAACLPFKKKYTFGADLEHDGIVLAKILHREAPNNRVHRPPAETNPSGTM